MIPPWKNWDTIFPSSGSSGRWPTKPGSLQPAVLDDPLLVSPRPSCNLSSSTSYQVPFSSLQPRDFQLKKLVTLDLNIKILAYKNSNTCNDSMTPH